MAILKSRASAPDRGMAAGKRARAGQASRGRLILSASGVMLALLTFPALADPARVESGGRYTREYDLKAAFLFNFTQFVEWPSECLPDSTTPFVIGVAGPDPFGASLDEIVANEKMHSHPIVVQRWPSLGDVTTCHILFVSRSETPHLHELLASLRGRGILTVGDSDRFATRGGVIGFATVGNRVRLEVNLDAARAQKLTISSQLLRQSTLIGASP